MAVWLVLWWQWNVELVLLPRPPLLIDLFHVQSLSLVVNRCADLELLCSLSSLSRYDDSKRIIVIRWTEDSQKEARIYSWWFILVLSGAKRPSTSCQLVADIERRPHSMSEYDYVES